MTVKEKRLIYLCSVKPRTLKALARKLRLHIVEVEAMVKRCEKYIEFEQNYEDHFKSLCAVNFEGKLIASDYKNQYLRWYYPMIISTLALIVSIIALAK